MTIIDLTYPYSENTPVYPGKTCLSKIVTANYEDGYRCHDITMGTGTGTHMDAPAHFDPKGYTIDQVPLDQCTGKASVLHLSDKVKDTADYAITAQDILDWEAKHGSLSKGAIVLFHTGWDRYWGEEKYCYSDPDGVCHYPGLSKEAAQVLVDREIKAVGIDTMSVDIGPSKDFPAHVLMLNKRIVLIENLASLKEVPPTGAEAWILPMKLKDCAEAPVRALAIV